MYEKWEASYEKEVTLAALRTLDLTRVTEALLGALKSDNRDVRLWAATQLAGQRDKAVVEALIEALANKDGDLRRNAADSLGKIGDVSAVAELVKRVADDKAEAGGEKDAALTALRTLDLDKVTEALLGALQSDNRAVRLWAAQRLSTQKDKAVVEANVLVAQRWILAQQAGRRRQQRYDVGRGSSQLRRTREEQQVLHHLIERVDPAQDLVHHARAGFVWRHTIAEDLNRAADTRQGILDLVSDNCGHFAECGERGLFAQLRFHPNAVAQVVQDSRDADRDILADKRDGEGPPHGLLRPEQSARLAPGQDRRACFPECRGGIALGEQAGSEVGSNWPVPISSTTRPDEMCRM